MQFGIDPQSCGGHGEPSAISIIIDELSDAMPLCAGTINIDTSNSKRPKVRITAIEGRSHCSKRVSRHKLLSKRREPRSRTKDCSDGARCFHVLWSDAAGGHLGVGNDPVYNGTRCFDPFPFPTPTPTQNTRLHALGEDLDAHRKARQAEHPKLTLTGMYNVLEKLRAGQRIEGRDREVYDQGLIGILRDLHDQIDAAVAEAYDWPATLSDDEILQNLVTLNRTRAAEEARGQIRWLRPAYQNPAGHTAAATEQAEMDVGVVLPTAKTPWPKTLPQQFAAVRAALDELGEATPDQIARHFARARATTVLPLLESLAALGHAQVTERGSYAA